LQDLTMIVPFYRNAEMLAHQVKGWHDLPDSIRFIVVDDGSPEPALPIVQANASNSLLDRIQVYRIGVDIPWNRGGARNLASMLADTDWLLHVDIDHTLPAESAVALMEFNPDRSAWYRFPRFRVGAADETRKKDAIPPGQKFGEIKPHIDSYLCTRDLYWKAGGYNENFSGCLGGGSPFLQILESEGPVSVLPAPICLHVHTRDSVPDASDFSLSRDTKEFARRKASMKGNFRGSNPIRFPWERVL